MLICPVCGGRHRSMQTFASHIRWGNLPCIYPIKVILDLGTEYLPDLSIDLDYGAVSWLRYSNRTGAKLDHSDIWWLIFKSIFSPQKRTLCYLLEKLIRAGKREGTKLAEEMEKLNAEYYELFKSVRAAYPFEVPTLNDPLIQAMLRSCKTRLEMALTLTRIDPKFRELEPLPILEYARKLSSFVRKLLTCADWAEPFDEYYMPIHEHYFPLVEPEFRYSPHDTRFTVLSVGKDGPYLDLLAFKGGHNTPLSQNAICAIAYRYHPYTSLISAYTVFRYSIAQASIENRILNWVTLQRLHYSAPMIAPVSSQRRWRVLSNQDELFRQLRLSIWEELDELERKGTHVVNQAEIFQEEVNRWLMRK